MYEETISCDVKKYSTQDFPTNSLEFLRRIDFVACFTCFFYSLSVLLVSFPGSLEFFSSRVSIFPSLQFNLQSVETGV